MPKQICFIRFRLQQFQTLSTLLSKTFSYFPHGTCLLSVSNTYLAADGIYHQFCAPVPRNVTPRTKHRAQRHAHDTQDLHPPIIFLFPKSFHMHRCWSLMPKKQFKAKGPNSHAVFVHVHPPLLIKSHVVLDSPLTYMLKFNGWTYLMLPRQICCIRCLSNIPCSQDRLTHVQVLLTWNPSPLQFSKFWFEYFLLPPRPALGTQTHTRGFITRSCAPLLTDASICNSGQVSATGLSACEVIGQAVLLF